MRFAACLKKDIRLLTGGGVRSLLFLALPILLVFVMIAGMSGVASKGVNVESFSIAVRDLDDTVMSRLLTTQLDAVSLFDRVIRVREESDEELMQGRCAAVVTIPKDFFYDLYDMEDTDVVIALNSRMPAEAAMVKTAFSSLVGILEQEQRLHYAAARVRYGELDSEHMREVYHDYSDAAVREALGRLDLFELSGAFNKGYDEKKLFFGASIISMLIMFIPLSVLRSVSEEMDAGLSSRFAAAGGNLFEAMLSKLVISFVMTFIPVACFIAILGLGKLSVLLPVLGVLFVFSFAFFLFVGCASGSAATAQLVGNIIMLLMLTLGGGLYPLQLMPDALQKIGAFTVPGALLGAMKQAYLSRGLAEILPGLVPHAIAAVAFFLLSLPFFGKRRRA